MTKTETEAVPAQPPYTMSIPAAGKLYLGLSRNGSYEAARRGDIPTIQIGRRKLAVVKAMEKRLADVATAGANRQA